MSVDDAALELLRIQARVFQDRLAALESRIRVGEKVAEHQDGRITAVAQRVDAHEEAIVDIRMAAMQFAAVAEDMMRLTESIQRDIQEERQP